MHHHVGPRTPPKWCTAAGHMVHPAAGEITLSYPTLSVGAHTAAHARKQGVFQMGVVSVPLTCAARSGTSVRAEVRRVYFAWGEGTVERSREPSEQRCA